MTFNGFLKAILINVTTGPMTSAELATSSPLKKLSILKKGYGIIISVQDVKDNFIT